MVARRAHNPKVTGSNPVPATNKNKGLANLVNPIFVALYPFSNLFNYCLVRIMVYLQKQLNYFDYLNGLTLNGKSL